MAYKPSNKAVFSKQYGFITKDSVTSLGGIHNSIFPWNKALKSRQAN